MDVGAFADKEETQEGWCRSIGGRYVPEEKVEEVLARRRERKHLNLKKNKAMAERAVDKLEVRLPMGTEKIILRPAGGIDSIKKKLGVFAGNAILEAAGLPPMAEEDIVFNKNNQTILISTPNKERAEAFAKIKNIRAGEEDIEMTAHPAMPEGGKGVIYGINLELTEEQIHKALDNPRNPTYTAVRRLGRSSESVIINFKDLEVPKTVKFFSQWIPCHLYKKKYDVCYACGKIGHRQDVCPDPRSTRCRGCGLRNPPEEHACEPKCLLCGKKHQLGDPTCRELYRKPHWVKQRDAARAEARAEQEKGGATAGRSRPTSKVALPPAAKKQRSESRDRSASRPPPRDNQTHWPGLQKPGDKRTHSGMPVSFASAVSQGRTPELEAQANLFKKEIEKRDEENSQLREIIKTLTETVNQLKEQVGQLTNPTVRATQAEPTRPLTPVQRIAAPQAQDEGSMVVDTAAADESWKDASSIYDFAAVDIDGNEVSLDKYKWAHTLIEPGTEADIKKFVEKYNVRFDMFSKINVNGDKAHPLWKYLKNKQSGFLTDAIKWNFTKFVVDKEGQPVHRYAPTTDPVDIEPDLLKLF
ncbi:hypothetical protein HPB49_016355 [Dermacentor silvarum]|uniref:Uncharacterized protein n=2 Tax=Dermacentor silvarum TaxID=543639 RepID=A0ACB8DJK4_DERSI|nr:hypothetical protein HPB49_016355 [Dermacentor silvarum]